MRVVCMDGSGMTYTSRRMQSGSRVRGRLEWEHDMETEPLSFAIRQPCPAAEKFETQKSGKNRTNQDLCTAVRRPKLMFLEPFVSPIGCFGQLNDALFTKLVGKAKGMEKGGGSILRSWQG